MKFSPIPVMTTLVLVLVASIVTSPKSVAVASPVHDNISIQPLMSLFYGNRRYRSNRNRTYRQSRQPSRPMSLQDLQSHYLDDENWMTDKNVRFWNPNQKIRRPNDHSWTSRLVGTNIVAFIVQAINPRVTDWGVQLGHKILQGKDLYRLISPIFLHGGLFHLFTNMYSLNNVGPMAERMYGPGRFLATYLVSGITGNILSSFASPNPSLGASGAVFGIVSSLYIFLDRNSWLLGAQGEAYSNAITQTLLLNLFVGAVTPQIDNWAHLGGAIGGAAMAYYFGPRLYTVKLPGDTGQTVVVDKPILRLPPSIEHIPTNVSNSLSRMSLRMQVWRYKSGLSRKPWRSEQGRRSDYKRRRQFTPKKSIKPKLNNDDEF